MKDSDSEAAAAIWKQIEISESYLVCSMYEEAASLASTILNGLRDGYYYNDDDDDDDDDDDNRATTTTEQQDMLQSTAMVLVQAFNQLGRTPEILDQLRSYFNSIKAIPPQVLLTGACFQIAQQGYTFVVCQFLEEFLNGWSLGDGQYHAVSAEPNVERGSSFQNHFVLGIDDYLEVVEVYAVTLLATVLQDVDLAISWIQNAPLPEENRQGLLRRLHSMHSLKTTISSQVASLQSHTSNNEGSPEALKGKHADDKTYRSKDGVLKLSERIETCFWCFRSINLKFGNAKFVIPSGKIMLGCLIFFVCYVFRRKQATLKRIVRRQVNATKRALGDLWQLAFSYEVDPLAAVQPLVAATHQGQ